MDDTTIKAMTSTGKDDWETPQDLFDALDREFHFTLDPCCTHESAKCKKHYTPAEDGLAQDWGGRLSSATLRTLTVLKQILVRMRGSRNAGRNHENPELPWLRCFHPGQKLNASMTIFWEKLKYGSSVVVSVLWITVNPPDHRFSAQ